MTKRQRSQAARRGWDTRRANERRAARAATREHRRRSAAARRGWDTRRARDAELSRPGAPGRIIPEGYEPIGFPDSPIGRPPAPAFDPADFDFDAYDGPWDEFEFGDSDADTGEVGGTR